MIAVLGAGGFIGSNAMEGMLRADEHEVIGVDVDMTKLADVDTSKATLVKVDVSTDASTLNEIVQQADCVLNLIAYANPSLYVKHPLDVVRLNLDVNRSVVDACVRHSTRLIQFSSAEIYGKPRPPETQFREDDSDFNYGPIDKQRWIYACAKQMLERIIHAHGQAGDLEYTIVRPFNFIGPRIDYLVPAGSMGGPRVFSHFMSALLTGGPMYLVDGGQATRSFTDIRDAIEALLVLLHERDASRSQTFNVGNPTTNMTIAELAELMRRVYEDLTGLEPKGQFVEVSGEEFYGVGYDDDGRHPPAIDKICSLGWAPTHSLEETLAYTMPFYVDPVVMSSKE